MDTMPFVPYPPTVDLTVREYKDADEARSSREYSIGMGGTIVYSKRTIFEVPRPEQIGWFRVKVKFIVAQRRCK